MKTECLRGILKEKTESSSFTAQDWSLAPVGEKDIEIIFGDYEDSE